MSLLNLLNKEPQNEKLPVQLPPLTTPLSYHHGYEKRSPGLEKLSALSQACFAVSSEVQPTHSNTMMAQSPQQMAPVQNPFPPSPSSAQSSHRFDRPRPYHRRTPKDHSAQKGKTPNNRLLHVMSERRKRRQMSYLFKQVQRALGVDPTIKLTMMDTLVMAIDKLSDGQIQVNLDEIGLDIEKANDDRFLED